MTEEVRRGGISPLTMAAGVLVVAGFALTGISWGFLVLVGIGAFGPGVLRELGWVHDKDELQLLAARRAGYHAYLAGGLAAILMIARVRSAAQPVVHADELATSLLAVIWFTWLVSSLHGYWGPFLTARRILIIFGAVWLLFNILGNISAGAGALLIQSLLAVPFFVLAWLTPRWPRLTGVLLLGAAVVCGYFFRLYEVFGPDPFARGRVEVIVLFLGPLAAGGLMLLGVGGPAASEPDDGAGYEKAAREGR